ncbi:MAG: Protein phosphatase 2C 2 [Trizodia sp. TS-e1964]|nr:MAG: Protein phosphatase 2C 2 [Trizodia sp. TS-e1964]
MGQTLSEPVVTKASESGGDERLLFGTSAMQGWRISMEDAHTAILDLQLEKLGPPQEHMGPEQRISFFGVYDGHGGEKVANFAGQQLHRIIAKQKAYSSGDFPQALKDGFLATDRAILNDPRYEDEVSGCTASVAIITNTKIYVGNAGDSRTVLGLKGRAKPLSFDHKPQNETEKSRITAAGGFVDFGRVNGNLALSRAIGDFEFKKSAQLPPEQQIVTAFPDVIEHELALDDEFLVIACDGIWDCQSSQAVVEFVRRGIAAKQELYQICENMMDNCLASNSETGGVGCDNMTITIIALLQGKTKEQWYDMVAERVATGDGPCAPPEYAEFRGPGVHHVFEDSDDNFDLDPDQRSRGNGTREPGRIILLTDGTELLTDTDDAGLFDGDDEDLDLESQVPKNVEATTEPTYSITPEHEEMDTDATTAAASSVEDSTASTTSTSENPSGMVNRPHETGQPTASAPINIPTEK